MLEAVSWKTFLSIIFILSLLYYLSLVLLFYKKEVIRLIRTKQVVTQPSDAQLPNTLIHELLEDLKQLFLKASRQGYPKEELILALQVLLRNYRSLKGGALEPEISNHIRTVCSEICSISLSDLELGRLWCG
jgi:hypothetical protein